MTARSLVTVLFLASTPLAGGAGCTHQVRPMPRIEAVPGEPLPLRAKYYIAPDQTARVYSNSFFALGIVHTWNVEIGAALAASFPKALHSVFTSVTPAAGPDDIADADVLLVPAITHFDISGSDFTSTIEVRVKATNGSAVLLDQVFEGTPTKGTAGTAWAAGYFGAEYALQRSAEYAFQDVMPKIAQQLWNVLAKAAPLAYGPPSNRSAASDLDSYASIAGPTGRPLDDPRGMH